MSRVNLILDEAELSSILLPHIRASFPGLPYDATVKVVGTVSVDFDLGLSLINKIVEIKPDAIEISIPSNVVEKKTRGRPPAATKEKTSISKKEFDEALIEIDANVVRRFPEGADLKSIILGVTASYPALRKGAIAERIEKAHRIWLQDHPATPEPIGLEKELDARIMELYPKHSTKEISDMLDEEGFIVTPKEIMQRVKAFQLKEIAKGAGKSIDHQLPDKGRSWKDDDDLKPLVEKDEELDTSDFGSQGMEADGVDNI